MTLSPEEKKEVMNRMKKILDMINHQPMETSEYLENQIAVAQATLNKMIEKYQLSISDITLHSLGEEIIKQDILDGDRIKSWKQFILMSLCPTYGVSLVRTAKSSKKTQTYTMIGRESDVQIVSYFFDMLCRVLESAAKDKASKYKLEKTKENQFISTFIMAAMQRIAIRMERDKKTETQESTPESKDLMVMTDTAVKQKLQEFYPKIKKESHNHFEGKSAFGEIEGSIFGERMQLSKGISGATGTTQLSLEG